MFSGIFLLFLNNGSLQKKKKKPAWKIYNRVSKGNIKMQTREVW